MRFPRGSGVLLHPTSLPGPSGSGDFGPSAYHFVDWLAAGGQTLWQMLPLGGIGAGNSPYMSSSAFAGNVLLVDLGELRTRGWLTDDDLAPVPGLVDHAVNFEAMIPYRMERLARAAARFFAEPAKDDAADYADFCAAHASWLADFALYMALAELRPGVDWCEWPAPLARREPTALEAAAREHAARIGFWSFCQWRFYRQWAQLKAYANEHGVRLVGDVPIFIALQSAEAWARPELFELDAHGRPSVVAGVPPDSFAATGQRWGNPLYRWPAHAAENYAWWTARLRRIFELVDIVRIDHFRGFAACWEIPADEPTAENGRWVPGPGAALFDAATAALGPLPVIAEDLGVITPDVHALRKYLAFPGMRILQFAWGDVPGQADERFLPHRHEADSVVFPGTHDNDTTVGWWTAAGDHLRNDLREYLATDGNAIHWDLIRTACASVADLAIFAMQDVLGLDGRHRMNFPGKPEGNWSWRFEWDMVAPECTGRLRRYAQMYERLPVPDVDDRMTQSTSGQPG